MKKKLWQLPAIELASLFLSQTVTPIEALEQCLGRIETVDKFVRAFTWVDRGRAFAAARAATERYKDGMPLGPLDGVPASVKDNLFVSGMPATWGSALYGEFVPATDDLAVQAMQRAGIVIVGKTNTPEFAMAGYTDNIIFGATGNPWNIELSPGGSSGGAAASVGFGMVPLALGTDAGGSIRRPAAHSGLVGLKPGIGRVPRQYGFPSLAADLQVVSPLARTVGDLQAFFSIISTPAPAPAKVQGRFRIGVVPVDPARAMEPAIAEGFDATVAILKRMGHDTIPVPRLWDAEEVARHFSTLVSAGVARVLSHHDGWESRVTPAIALLGRQGEILGAKAYVSSLDWMQRIRARFATLLAGVDLLAMPTSGAFAWPKHEPSPPIIGGRPASGIDASANTTIINFTGLPAISVPMPVSGALPAGLQLVAPMNCEERLFSIAEAIEEAGRWSLPGLAFES